MGYYSGLLLIYLAKCERDYTYELLAYGLSHILLDIHARGVPLDGEPRAGGTELALAP